ncbi:uncharacterized protein [Oscarella lobularis]|uniref:uncharacterized protein n=1 Tax=Oscarella lobularis TaxID=121494 RepID=UPI0033137958
MPYRVRLLLSDVDVYDICVNPITGADLLHAHASQIDWDHQLRRRAHRSHRQRAARSLANSGHVYWTDWGGASASVRKARLDGSGELTLGTSRADRTHDAFRRYLSPSRDVIERCKVNGMDRVRSRIGIDVEVCTLRATVVVGRMEKISVDAGVTESEDDGVQIVPSYLVRTEMAGVTDFVIYQDMPMPDNPCAVNNGNCIESHLHALSSFVLSWREARVLLRFAPRLRTFHVPTNRRAFRRASVATAIGSARTVLTKRIAVPVPPSSLPVAPATACRTSNAATAFPTVATAQTKKIARAAAESIVSAPTSNA